MNSTMSFLDLVNTHKLYGDFLPFSLFFRHSLSFILHFLLCLLLVPVWFLANKRHGDGGNSMRKPSGFLYNLSLGCSLGLCGLFLFLCVFNWMKYWDGTGSLEILATQVDFIVQFVAWMAVSLFLKYGLRKERKYPIWIRLWCVVFLTMSVYSLVVDFVFLEHTQITNRYVWVELLSVFIGSFLCYACFYGDTGDESAEDGFREPLLSNGSLGKKDGSSDHVSTPYATASFFSKLTFSWMNPLLSLGCKKALDPDDVPQVAEKDRARTILPVFLDRLYEEDKGNSTENVVGTLKLVKALILSVWKEVVWTAFLCLVSTLAAYVGPYMIESFVEYLSGNLKSPNEGYVLIGTFFGAKVVECLCHRHWFFTTRQIGVRNRAALNAVIYNKGLSLSSRAKQGHSSGEVINLMSVDAERVGDFSWYFHELWVVPLQIVIALFILYRNLGAASFASIVATFVVMSANIPLGKLEEYFQDNIMEAKDERMKATTETLRNMRILKLYGWEMRFLSKILDLRRSETSWLKKYVYASAGTSFVLWNAPTFIAVVSFGTCMLFGMPLTTGRILSSLATFEVLEEPIYGLPEAISMIVQTKVSLTRIASFLNEEDIQQDAVQRIGKDPSAPAVEIRDGNFSWDLTLEEPTLRGLNLRVEHGMRVAVCGTVGSGKTSLLSSILGEVPKVSGSVRLSGMTAYVPQSPWIQSGTIEDNILFGKKMDRYRYDNILDVCALKKDLAILPFGDQTFIGERGINLSGGQKQRIQIARALYQDADIYLLDDPFSAVDAHTGTHLFQECLLGFLSSRTVIYVTHQVEFLSSADLILVMRDGSITQAGPYSAILQSGTDFMQLVGAQEEAMSALNEIEAARASEVSGVASLNESQEETRASIDKPKDVNVNGKSEEIEDHGQLVQEEEREKGRVSLSIYWDYLRAAYGGALVPLILLAEITFQVLQIGSNYWMAWATPISDTQPAPVSASTLILVYVALSGASSVFVLAKSLLIGTVGYKTAMILFNKMHQCIFRAPMSFFDSTPTGRILNRVSGDQSEVDLSIPQMMGAVAFGVIHLVVIIAVMSQVAWQVFIVFIPVVAACIWLQQYYIATARELSRLIGICTAPILQHFAETVSGSSVIRSFKEESRFAEKNLNLIDGLSGPKFHNSAATEWLCFRMDILSSLTFAFSLAFLVFLPAGVIAPGIAGLAVTYGLSLNMLQAMVIWSLCNLENAIVSVERILQFTHIPSEPPLVVDTNKPSGDWPSCGRIDITDLQIRYASHLPVVLRGLTCTFHGGTKTGIVGRTGSGKSTLVQALFRIVDPLGGHILIDGVDILTIGLHDLRTRLSIIPQDPMMFEGTIRSNLDPLEEHTDAEIWEALDKCQLGNIVRQKEAKLDSIVTENGENWSVGQRQLVCLGRVLLRRSRILVLDEATASVDTATDSLIQHTLREQFTDCTVITIAHRIGSVLDSDMVLLLDNGTVLEHDSPQRLLEDKSSAFSKLVAEYTTRSNHHV